MPAKTSTSFVAFRSSSTANRKTAASGATSSAQDPSVDDEPSYPTNESTEVPKKNRSLLRVPSRSSSQKIQPSPTSTGLSGVTASDPTDSIGRRSKESKISIVGRRRNGSVASSKRSEMSTGASHGNVNKANALTSQTATMQKPSKSRGFLGLLNCCGVPDNANGVDSDDKPMPIKQVTKASSQAVPTKSSKPESSILQPRSSRSTIPQPEKEAVRQFEPPQDSLVAGSEEPSPTPPRGKLGNPQDSTDQKASSKDIRNQPLPAVPLETEKSTGDQASSMNPAVVVRAPSPVSYRQDDTISAPTQTWSEEDTAKDSTMTDAPPLAAEDVKALTEDHQEQQSDNSSLPPPPPLPIAEPGKNSVNHQASVNVDPVEEKHQWLLPPIEPRFQGKKCLVLDLDETLVHSSFKVTPKTKISKTSYSLVLLQILHQADFTIPVEIEGQYHNVYVIKRPGVDQFMKRVGELYEIVVFTASVSKVFSSPCANFSCVN